MTAGGKYCFAACAAGLLLWGMSGTAFVQADTESAEESGISVDTSGDESFEDFTYRENDTGVTITSCDTSASAIDVPGEIDGKPVTEIGEAAFMNCQFLTSITVPETVTEIGESAFNGCTMLSAVTLPEGLTAIGKGAFESCEVLVDVQLPSGLTELPDALFYQCSALPGITLPEHLEVIGNEVFYSCTSLREITLPESLTAIGDYAFQNCQGLTTFHLPASCTELGIYALDGCQALTEITVAAENPAYTAADGVLFTADQRTLLRYPQSRAKTVYTVPDPCTELADWSFIGATTLEELDLNQVTEIGEDCFYYCGRLQEVTIPEGVTELKGAAFAYCLELQQVTLPDTMRQLGDHCFYSCASLEQINIPEGVTALGERCFYNCAMLLDLTLPASIAEIGEEAIGYYTPSDADRDEAVRMDKLSVHNEGSDAVDAYMKAWKSGSYWGWIIGGICILAAAGGILAAVLIHRSRNRVRVTSRHAPEPKQKQKTKPKQKSKRK